MDMGKYELIFQAFESDIPYLIKMNYSDIKDLLVSTSSNLVQIFSFKVPSEMRLLLQRLGIDHPSTSFELLLKINFHDEGGNFADGILFFIVQKNSYHVMSVSEGAENFDATVRERREETLESMGQKVSVVSSLVHEEKHSEEVKCTFDYHNIIFSLISH